MQVTRSRRRSDSSTWTGRRARGWATTYLALPAKPAEQLVGLELGLLVGHHPRHLEDKPRELVEDAGRLEGQHVGLQKAPASSHDRHCATRVSAAARFAGEQRAQHTQPSTARCTIEWSGPPCRALNPPTLLGTAPSCRRAPPTGERVDQWRLAEVVIGPACGVTTAGLLRRTALVGGHRRGSASTRARVSRARGFAPRYAPHLLMKMLACFLACLLGTPDDSNLFPGSTSFLFFTFFHASHFFFLLGGAEAPLLRNERAPIPGARFIHGSLVIFVFDFVRFSFHRIIRVLS